MSISRELARLRPNSSGQLPTANIQDAAITTAKIADGAVVEVDIANSAVTNAKIASLAASKLSGQLPYANISSGSIISVSTVRSSTRTSMPATTSAIAFSGNFTKQLNDSIIIATATVFGGPFQSGNCGVGLRLDSTWDYGAAYQYDGAWGSSQATIVVATGRWSGISAGSRTMAFGWNSLVPGSERPFEWLNPNSNNDPRNQQMISSIVIYEVAP